MAPGIFERIQAKIELFRLEQRYTRRRHRRSTFVSNAIYVDGEYIYQTPASTGNSGNTSSSSSHDVSSPTSERNVGRSATTDNIPSPAAEKPGKRLNRFSSMPGFGSLSKATGARASTNDWRTSRVSVNEVR